MQLPENTEWTYLATPYGTDEGTAFLSTPDFLLHVTHQTRDQVILQVREPRSAMGYDFQNRGEVIEFGWHRSPAEAFAFAEAYVRGTENFRPTSRGRLSARYSEACAAAYSRR